MLYLAQGFSLHGYLEFVESLLVANTVDLVLALSNWEISRILNLRFQLSSFTKLSTIQFLDNHSFISIKLNNFRGEFNGFQNSIYLRICFGNSMFWKLLRQRNELSIKITKIIVSATEGIVSRSYQFLDLT